MAGFISFPFSVGSTTNVAAISKSGIYSYNDEAMSTATGYAWGMLVHFQNNANWGTFQLAVTNMDGDNSLYFRRKSSSSWGNWIHLQ